MRIDRLELLNFRGFERLELELHPRLTLLIGVNGSGKSNALEGLAVALGAWLLGLTDASRNARKIRRGDIRHVVHTAAGAPSLEPRFPVVVAATGVVAGVHLTWQRKVSGVDAGHHFVADVDAFDVPWQHDALPEVPEGILELRAIAGRSQARLEGAQDVALPLLAYYRTSRLWAVVGDANHRTGERVQKLGPRVRGYEQCLAAGATHERLEAWMAWRTEVSLQQLSEHIKAGGVLKDVPRSPQLEAIEQAVLRCVQGAKRFFYDVNHQELRLELDTGELVPFSQLSDGYRNLVAMVADITWRASQLNPHYGADAARKATGIVLIDELELHLHPAWQRRVIDNLLDTFPNLQFVATTHSPQIIASARPEHTWLLHEGKAHRPGPVHGKDSNAILRDLMGVGERPQWMEELLERLARLLEAGALEEAKALMTEIVGDLGHDDPTVVGLQWELHDLEVHGAPDPEAT